MNKLPEVQHVCWEGGQEKHFKYNLVYKLHYTILKPHQLSVHTCTKFFTITSSCKCNLSRNTA